MRGRGRRRNASGQSNLWYGWYILTRAGQGAVANHLVQRERLWIDDDADHLIAFEYAKANDLDAALAELCDLRVRSSVRNCIGHYIVGGEVVERDDATGR